jgi:hypothetical protein
VTTSNEAISNEVSKRKRDSEKRSRNFERNSRSEGSSSPMRRNP